MSDNQRIIARLPNRIPVDDIYAVRDIPVRGPGTEYVITLGRINVQDGYAREYYYDALAMNADDSDNYLLPNDLTPGDPGRWIKVDRPIPKTFYKDIVNLAVGGTIAEDIVHDMDTWGIVAQVYLHDQTIDGTPGCLLLSDKVSLGATTFEIGAKDENTAIVNLINIPIGTYRFTFSALPYRFAAP